MAAALVRADGDGAAMTMRAAELDQVVAEVARGPGQRRLYRDLIRRADVAISPAESWVLWHIGAHGPISTTALAARLEVEPNSLRAIVEALGSRGYVLPDRYGVPDLTATGRRALVALVKAGQDEVTRLTHEPGGERERGRVVRRLTRAALREMPGHIGPAPGHATAYPKPDLGWLPSA
jgi:DNA-binding MarR family transcriptional regulator